MILLAIVTALLLEQVRPLASHNPAAWQLQRWARWAARNVDTGRARHAWLAWALAVAVPALAVAAVHVVLLWLGDWPLALLWMVAVLYLTLGFRQFSHHFTAIRDALEVGDDERARQLLAHWQHVDVGSLPRTELPRLVLEHSVLAAHRHVFGVLVWFCLLAVLGLGPAGAVFYRQTEAVSRHWQHDGAAVDAGVSAELSGVADDAWRAVDWLPARATALGLAIVGSFEDAIDVWRQHAARFANPNDGVILAAMAGALGVRLGGASLRATPRSAVAGAPAGGGDWANQGLPGETASTAHFARVVGLMWRMVALWLLVLVLLTLAHVLG